MDSTIKTDKNLTRNTSFLMRTTNKICIIDQINNQKDIKKVIEAKLTIQIKYLKFQNCILPPVHKLFRILRKIRDINSFEVMKIRFINCKFIDNLLQRSSSQSILKFNKSISKLHTSQFAFDNLLQLNVSGNQLRQFPFFDLGINFYNLLTLDISQNAINNLGDTAIQFLKHFQSLKQVIIKNNPLKSIHRELIVRYKKLVSFELSLAIQKLNFQNSQSILKMDQICSQIIVCLSNKQIQTMLNHLIIHNNRHYLQILLDQLILKLNAMSYIPIIHSVLNYGYINRQFQQFNILIKAVSQQKVVQGQKWGLFSLFSLDQKMIMPIDIDVYRLAEFVNLIGKNLDDQLVRQKYIRFIKSSEFRCVVNRILINLEQIELLFNLISESKALSDLIRENIIQILQNKQILSVSLAKCILLWDNWSIMQYFCQVDWQMFANLVINQIKWRSIVKPKHNCFKILKKMQKKYIKKKVSQSRTQPIQNMRQYKLPAQYIFHNDIHDYSVLTQYENFHSSHLYKDYSQVIKYRNRENSFSVAKKIQQQIKYINKFKFDSKCQNKGLQKHRVKRVSLRNLTNYLNLEAYSNQWKNMKHQTSKKLRKGITIYSSKQNHQLLHDQVKQNTLIRKQILSFQSVQTEKKCYNIGPLQSSQNKRNHQFLMNTIPKKKSLYQTY